MESEMRADGLSEPERGLWMEFSYGTHIDLRTGDPQCDDPAGAQSWEPERIVRAEVIRDLLVGRPLVDEQRKNQQSPGQSPSVFLSGARITGQLDLRGLDFTPPLLLQQCALDEPLVIADSMSRSIRLYGCHLPGVQGSWLKCAGDLHLRGCQINGMVDLAGAYIGGQLVLSGSRLSNPLKIAVHGDGLVVAGDLFCRDGAVVEGEVSLVAARVGGEIRFSSSTLTNPGEVALRADRLVVADDMYCRERLEIDGEVRLHGAHIKGVLDFSTTKIRNSDGVAIQADQLTVGSDLCCDESFSAEGMIDLTDVHVNGELNFSNATLNNPGNVALHAPRLIVDQDMFCRDEFTVDGTVCLVGAHIGDKLSFTSARLTGAILTEAQLSETRIEQILARGVKPVELKPDPPAGKRWAKRRKHDTQVKLATDEETAKPGIVNGESGLALVADGLRVDIDMTCEAGFTSRGEIRLKGARIGRNLDFSDAEVNNEKGAALNAEDMQAERMLMPASCEAGRISLRYGKMVELDDKRGVRSDQIDITGLSYETLIPPMDPDTRLLWLAENDYEPQPYDQMARSYRRLRYEDSARKVQSEQERRRRDTLPRGRKIFSRLQDLAIGYGYLPHRAATAFVIVLLVGVAVFWFQQPHTIDGKAVHFNPIFYTLNVLIPFMNFGQRDLWDSASSGLEVFKVCLAGLGWLLAIIAFPGIKRWLTRS